jgi:hypothetical protein
MEQALRMALSVQEAETQKKNLAPSSILREAKVAYYARNMIEAGWFVLFFVKAT